MSGFRCKECGNVDWLGVITHSDTCKYKNGYGCAGDVTIPIGASGSVAHGKCSTGALNGITEDDKAT